jgi:hypothetical protein
MVWGRDNGVEVGGMEVARIGGGASDAESKEVDKGGSAGVATSGCVA